MIILRLLGGLGNQLFIYAFGRALELEHNLDVYFDTFSGFKRDAYKRKYELDNFNVNLKKVSIYASLFYPINKRSKLIIKSLYPNSVYIEEYENLRIDLLRKFLEENKKIFLQGYFQNLKYFENIKDELRKEIVIKTELSTIAKKYLEQINNSNSVAVHIRRKERKELVPIKFYLTKIKILEQKIDNPKYFIFSDEIEWCKTNLEINKNIVYVENTLNQIEDFWLMKNCRHFIIGNSTFSWWASWLSDNKNKILINFSKL